MRKIMDLQLEKFLELLEELGLNNEQMEYAESYLEHGEEDVLKQMPDRNFMQADGKLVASFSNIFNYFKNKGKETEYVRCFNLLFTMGGSTTAFLLPAYEFGYNVVLNNRYAELLDPVMLLSVYSEKKSNDEYVIRAQLINSIIKIIKSSPESPEQVVKKVKACHKGDRKNSLIFVYCAYFKLKEEECGSERMVLNRSLEDDSASFLKEYEEYILDFMDNVLVPKPGCGSKTADLKTLKDFIRTKHDSVSISPAVSMVIRNYNIDDKKLILPVGCAFYNYEISHVLHNFVNVCLNIDMHASLNVMNRFLYVNFSYTDVTGYSEAFTKMTKDFLLNIPEFLHWCAINVGTSGSQSRSEVLNYHIKNYNKDYILSLKSAPMEIYGILFQALKWERPEQAEEIVRNDREKLRIQYIRAIIPDKVPFYDDLYDFIYGSKRIEVLYPYEKEIVSQGMFFYGNRSKCFHDYMSIMGRDDTFKRFLAYYCFAGNGSASSSSLSSLFRELCTVNVSNRGRRFESQKVKQFFADVDSTGLRILYQLNAMGKCYDEGGWSQEVMMENILPVLSGYLEKRQEETLKAFKDANASGRMMGVAVLGKSPENYRQELLSAFADSSKAVKERLVEIIAANQSFRKDVLEKLCSKKAAERETSVLILSKWNTPEDREALQTAFDTEKSAKLRNLISDILNIHRDTDTEEENVGVDGFIKNMVKGNRKKTVAWAFETPFSSVHDKEGKEADHDYMMALLLCYSTMDIPGVSKDAPILADNLNPQELALFMKELFEKWVERGAEAKKKWVLYASSIHGGAEIVTDFQHYINEWPKVSRGAIAAEAVKALALNDSPAALLIVDAISRKFKFRQIKNAAGAALAFAAEQLGLTKEELADRIVPDLGFNEHMERIFDYGERQFKVYINQALEIEVYDNKDKKLKNLPAPGKRDDEAKAAEAYAEFKQMKKQMKTTVATQKTRLELALSVERKWKCDDWKNLFIKNPIMHQFAISLIWGVYENGVLTDTFRYMEDGSFNTAEEEEYELDKDCLIGLVHPVELGEDLRKTWLEQLEDYEITQSIEQLERKIFEPTEKELSEKYLERFGGKTLNGLSLNGKLSAMGWYRGSVQDAGGYFTFYREDESLGLGVELHFSGAYVGGENQDVTVYHAIFYKANTVKRGSYVYDKVKEKDMISLKDIPKRYFSEIVYQLQKATASSTETEEDWRKEAYWEKK